MTKRRDEERRWLRDAAATEHEFARWAMLGLLANAAFDGIVLLLLTMAQTGSADAMATLAQVGDLEGAVQFALLVSTAIVFLRWVRRAYEHAHRWEDVPPRFSPSAAVWAFFIPVVSLYRPYRVLLALLEASDPDELRPVTKRVHHDASTYRDGASVVVEELPWRIDPPTIERMIAPTTIIGLWWGLYTLSYLIAAAAGKERPIAAVFASCAMSTASAVLGVFMVQGIDARRQERLRRASWALRNRRRRRRHSGNDEPANEAITMDEDHEEAADDEPRAGEDLMMEGRGDQSSDAAPSG